MNPTSGVGRALVSLALGAVLALAPRAAAAHPHIFVEHHMEVLFDQHGVSGIRMSWSFDEMYSSTLRTDYTDSKKGPITAKDVKSLRDQHFAPVARHHFFSVITINGEPVPADQFTAFDAAFDEDKAVYSFTIPLKPAKPDPSGKNTIEISVFDPEYYIDFELAATDPVKVVGGEAIAASCTNASVPHETIGWGQVDSDIVTCTYNGSAS